jgi:hypothetical protein
MADGARALSGVWGGLVDDVRLGKAGATSLDGETDGKEREGDGGGARREGRASERQDLRERRGRIQGPYGCRPPWLDYRNPWPPASMARPPVEMKVSWIISAFDPNYANVANVYVHLLDTYTVSRYMVKVKCPNERVYKESRQHLFTTISMHLYYTYSICLDVR